MAGVTPSQTVGPYWAIGMPWKDSTAFTGEPPANAITVWGHVLDGAGDPVPDSLIESWQADAGGRFDHPDDPRGATVFEGFSGFARSGTDNEGRWAIRTLKPGAIPAGQALAQQPGN